MSREGKGAGKKDPRGIKIRPSIRRDNEGVLDLPFKLIIMMLLMGAILPLSIMGYRDTSRARYERKVEDELHHLVSMCQRLSIEGNLSSARITLDLEGDMFSSLAHIHIGDSLGKKDWMIDYRFDWREETDYIAATDPMVHMTSPGNSTLRLKGGRETLELTHCIEDRLSYIRIDIVRG